MPFPKIHTINPTDIVFDTQGNQIIVAKPNTELFGQYYVLKTEYKDVHMNVQSKQPRGILNFPLLVTYTLKSQCINFEHLVQDENITNTIQEVIRRKLADEWCYIGKNSIAENEENNEFLDSNLYLELASKLLGLMWLNQDQYFTLKKIRISPSYLKGFPYAN